MIITAQGGGGFSGVAEYYRVDTASLADGERLEQLLRTAERLPAPPQPVGADMAQWRLAIDDGKSSRVLHFTEDGSAASAPFQALIAALRARA